MKKNLSSSDITKKKFQLYNNENQNISNLNYNYSNNLTDNNLNDLVNDEIDSTNNLNNSMFNILQKKNQNLKNQIIILTKRIKDYENNYINDNNRKINQLKEFSELESDLNNQINNKNKIINSIQEENNYLKSYINKMDNDINILRDEVKNLLISKREQEKEIESRLNNQNIINSPNENKNLLEIVKKYSDEIIYLKNENQNLINHLNILNNNNKNNLINEEIERIKIEKNEEQSKFQKFLNNFVKEINEEIFVLSQWIETYLGNEYGKGYEIPSLMNDLEIDDKMNLINFDLLKSSLEKSVMKLNTILNNKENEVIKLNNIIKEKENKNDELKKEMIGIRKKQIELNDIKNELILQQEKDKNDNIKNKNIINNLKQSNQNFQNNNINYIKYLYEMINKEINAILSDINFSSYHDKFINIREKDNIYNKKEINDMNFFEEKLNNSLIKIIEFIEELKYDYIQIKKEKMILIKENANNKGNIELNNNDELIEEYKFKIKELLNDNQRLKNHIDFINKNNQLKLFKDDKIEEKLQIIEKENQDLRNNNNNLLNKLNLSNVNYLELESENNKLKERLINFKNMENDDENLKQKINDLSNDYQRLLKENNSLKNFLNSSN